MGAIRFALVLILLAAVPSSAFCQLLPRRRAAAWNAIQEAATKRAVDWAAKVLADAIVKASKELFEDIGHVLELDGSMRLFAEMQMDPHCKKRIDGIADSARKAALTEVMEKGSLSVFLSETAKFAEKLKSEKFSSPILKKMYLEAESDGGTTLGAGKEAEFLALPIVMGDFLEKEDLPTESRDRRSVMCFVRQRPKDPKNMIPVTVHCSFEFTAEREAAAFTKTLSFDLYLEQLKREEGAYVAYPWKVKNVQYK